jgi:hypothetical protein
VAASEKQPFTCTTFVVGLKQIARKHKSGLSKVGKAAFTAIEACFVPTGTQSRSRTGTPCGIGV